MQSVTRFQLQDDILDILTGEDFNNELKGRIHKKKYIQEMLEELKDNGIEEEI